MTILRFPHLSHNILRIVPFAMQEVAIALLLNKVRMTYHK
jgi:hypothetical protein